AIDRTDLADDPRFADLFSRAANAAALVAELDQVFSTHTRDEWAAVFDGAAVLWAPVHATHELPDALHAVAARCFHPAATGDGGWIRMVASPVDFGANWSAPAGPSPEMAQHTEEILLDLGYDWEAIIELKEAGAVA